MEHCNTWEIETNVNTFSSMAFLNSNFTIMSNTFKHKINTKYRLGLVEKVPISMKKYWNRINFDNGVFLALRAKKKEQILDNEMDNQLNENEKDY